MITFKQFLMENPSADGNLEDFVEKIKSDCAPFLAEAGGGLFFRGMYTNGGSAGNFIFPYEGDDRLVKGKPRKDRRPKDSPMWLHDVMNEVLKDLTGKNVRSEALFASADFGMAANYGRVFCVFPRGNFDYVWSTKTADPSYEMYMGLVNDALQPENTVISKKFAKDLLEYLKIHDKEAIERADNNINDWIMNYEDDVESVDGVLAQFTIDFIRNNDIWTFNKNLKRAATTKYAEYEVMFLCDEFYAVDCSEEATLKLLTKLLRN